MGRRQRRRALHGQDAARGRQSRQRRVEQGRRAPAQARSGADPEQRRAREQDEERKRQLGRQNEETGRRDRALLASYASESEIDLARARALGTIDAVLQSTGAYIEQLNRRRTDVAARIATYTQRPPPPALEREIESIDAELGRQAQLVARKQKEVTVVNARYDADKARYRELSGARSPGDATTGVAPQGPRTASNGGSSTLSK